MPLNSLAKASSGESKPRRVYVRQYTFWWSFPLEAWIDFCLTAYVSAMHESEGFSLPLNREIKHYPSHAVYTPVQGGRDVMAKSGYRVCETLDWDEDCFLEELAALGVRVCIDCVGADNRPVRLPFDADREMRTDWYGVLQYAQCPSCLTTYVSQDGRAAEVAA